MSQAFGSKAEKPFYNKTAQNEILRVLPPVKQLRQETSTTTDNLEETLCTTTLLVR